MTSNLGIEGLRVEGLLGEGAFSQVHAARRIATDEPVAVKVLHTHLRRNADAVVRTLQEGRFCWSLDHPNVVRVLDAGVTQDRRPYVVMERLCGETLRQRLDREGPLSEAVVLDIARQTARGLEVIHRRAVHRDIKPDNLFLCRGGEQDGRVKILDLGIASLNADDPEKMVQTAEGVFLGTPVYTAPEAFRGIGHEPRSDLYGLGATLFECLCGRPPYMARTILALSVIVTRAEQPPPLPRDDVSPGAKRLIARCLAPRLEDRWQDARALLDAIDGAQRGLTTVARQGSTVRLAGRLVELPSPRERTRRAFEVELLEVCNGLFHPAHVPPEILVLLTALEQRDSDLHGLARRREQAEVDAAALAGRLAERFAAMQERLADATRVLAHAEQDLRTRERALAALRQRLQALDDHFVDTYHALEAINAALADEARRDLRPVDPAAPTLRDARALAASLRDVQAERQLLVEAEAEGWESTQGARLALASAGRVKGDLHHAITGIESERLGALMELETRARLIADDELLHERHRHHLFLSLACAIQSAATAEGATED